MRKTNNGQLPGYISAQQFETVHFYDPELKRQIIILYALGTDGIIREFVNGEWHSFPITDQPAEVEELKA